MIFHPCQLTSILKKKYKLIILKQELYWEKAIFWRYLVKCFGVYVKPL